MSMINRMLEQRGLSMIELMVFIVVVGVAVTGVLSVYSSISRTSVDPMVRKQALAVAESLLEEVLSKPYTYCDPDDSQADTATSATIGPTGCATTTEAGIGREVAQGESRYSTTAPFDNVNDYNNFSMPAGAGLGIIDLTNTSVRGLNAYTATVQVQAAGPFNGIPAGETLRVTVTVTGPGNHSISLSGYRTRYAPTL
jgi:MSHA pilin protein MshD